MVSLSLEALKKAALEKLRESETDSSSLLQHLKSSYPCTENEGLFAIVEAILERKIKYRVENGMMIYSLGEMSGDELSKVAKDMEKLIKLKDLGKGSVF